MSYWLQAFSCWSSVAFLLQMSSSEVSVYTVRATPKKFTNTPNHSKWFSIISKNNHNILSLFIESYYTLNKIKLLFCLLMILQSVNDTTILSGNHTGYLNVIFHISFYLVSYIQPITKSSPFHHPIEQSVSSYENIKLIALPALKPYSSFLFYYFRNKFFPWYRRSGPGSSPSYYSCYKQCSFLWSYSPSFSHHWTTV